MVQNVYNQWKFLLFQIRRLYLLLTVKESAIEVPTNSEVRRRVAFFTNSLFMDMPHAPRVRKMLSFRCSTVSLISAMKMCMLSLIENINCSLQEHHTFIMYTKERKLKLKLIEAKSLVLLFEVFFRLFQYLHHHSL